MHQLSHHIFEIDHFLTNEECQAFIAFSEDQGYQSADVQVFNSRQHLSNIRNNDRVNLHDENLAEQWWEKLSAFDLPTVDGREAVFLSPHFRFYKYSPGQKFNMHKDGRQSISGHETLFTLLVYLNEGYEGGETKFRQDGIEIKAKTGSALIFEHHLWHQGCQLTSGNKYVLRTDIAYTNLAT